MRLPFLKFRPSKKQEPKWCNEYWRTGIFLLLRHWRISLRADHATNNHKHEWFSGIQSDCKIYVPYSEDHRILEAYQTADYWSTYASKMVEESA